ncbi:hypothetical protein O181_058260 [Austropuccinia psidii MF-1]|uniref:Integrase zinc-binding domain-containing protein n=1 Tax=Austropuccinia psidii MF-1 TaxID=1389203 RepID=A0A9Q3HXP7_9BASI|nr:hypothetical protein [Austropuccinia psidii MF-1]
MRFMTRNPLEYSGLSSAKELFSFLFLPPLKFSSIILDFNTSCHHRSSLSVKPAGLNFSLNFIFLITYLPGHLASLPDTFSCRDNIYPDRAEDFVSKNPINYQKIIRQDKIQASKFFEVKVKALSSLIDSIQKVLWKALSYRIILQDLGKGKSVQDYFLDSSSQLLLFKDWVVVPNDPIIQLNILQNRHESPLAGHSGQEKTLRPFKWDSHWSGKTQFIEDYVSSCQQCSRNKTFHHKKFGLLKPLPIPMLLGFVFQWISSLNCHCPIHLMQSLS